VVSIKTQLIIILVVHVEVILPVVGTVELVVNESATEKSVSRRHSWVSDTTWKRQAEMYRNLIQDIACLCEPEKLAAEVLLATRSQTYSTKELKNRTQVGQIRCGWRHWELLSHICNPTREIFRAVAAKMHALALRRPAHSQNEKSARQTHTKTRDTHTRALCMQRTVHTHSVCVCCTSTFSSARLHRTSTFSSARLYFPQMSWAYTYKSA